MLVIDQSFEIMKNDLNEDLKIIEAASRTCYKSEAAGDPAAHIRRRIKSGHKSVLEHSRLTVRFTTNRGMTHELVRHRIASFSQESTRYVNYEKRGMVMIRPQWCSAAVLGEWKPDYRHLRGMQMEGSISKRERIWLSSGLFDEEMYKELLEDGCIPQQARDILPNGLKTEIVVTTNAREWRHIFNLRTAGTTGAPHPDMVAATAPLLRELKSQPCAVLFEDIPLPEGW